MKDSIKPILSAGRTRVQVDSSIYTYDESGLSFDANINYGGVYGEDITPIISFASVNKPKSSISSVYPNLTVNRTNVRVNSQSYTYDESGIRFDDAIEYGGIFGEDIMPIIAMALSISPSISFGNDYGATVIPTPPVPGDNSGMLIGILGLLYP